MKQLYFFVFLSALAMADDTNLEEVFHAANNKFTGNFFFEVAAKNPGKSVVISAYSVMTPLALLSLASVGASHDELLNAMGIPNDNVTRAVFSYAGAKLRSVQGVELKEANRVYIPLKYELNPEFKAMSRDSFHSEVTNVDFTKNVEVAKEINDWVEDQTNHRIKDLINPNSLDENSRAVLVNALYFKGTWKSTFNKRHTLDQDFYVTKDKVVKVPMMNKKAEFMYMESDKLQAKILEMPYDGEKTSMMILLPYEVNGINELLQKLRDLSLLDEESKKMNEVEVEVSIPKFKIETTTDLKEILPKINIKRIFTPGEAKLDKLLKENEDLYVSSATQKAFIEVNEEGAEAAAANEFGIAFLSASVSFDPYTFVADHPYVFLLKQGNNILFCGTFFA